jgi:hypothetical protein
MKTLNALSTLLAAMHNRLQHSYAFLLLITMTCCCSSLFAQNNNSTSATDTSTDTAFHSPKKAAIMSALLPGLGQIYNKKYWKLPIVYGGAAVTGYLIYFNAGEYNRFKTAYIFATDDDPTTTPEFPNASAAQLKIYRDEYRRNLELSIMGAALIYALNIVDAVVDAHLFDFDVSNDLTLHLTPGLQQSPYRNMISTGVTITLSF